ncbi:MAG: magnesium transporter [Erysipelotrichaceae bacterium]|nr:magnesium transporter [Erysipelotrichaceae bacterium]
MKWRTDMLEKLEELLKNKNYTTIRLMLEEYNVVDIATVIESLKTIELVKVFRLLPKDMAADVFSYLNSDKQQEIVESLNNSELALIIDDLYADDAVDLIEEMPAIVVKRLIGVANEQTRKEINLLLQYPEDSAGSMMTTEFVDLDEDMTIRDAIRKIRNVGKDSETIDPCYVTNPKREILGYITLRRLLLSQSNQLIKDVMEDNVICVNTHDDQENVAHRFQKYDFITMPVVDNEKRLVGIVTVDDIIDIIQEETTEDIEKMAAIVPTDKPYLKMGVFETFKTRIPWLLLLMISASITGRIIQGYEAALSSYVILTSFIPMLMDTGGNSGSQASVSIIRALSLNELRFKDTPKIVWKEFRVSILIGLVLAIANFIKIILIDQNSLIVAFVVCMTLFLTVVIAKLVGCLLPIGAQKIGFDPAIMASPFITTIVDALSLIVYFNIAGMLLTL